MQEIAAEPVTILVREHGEFVYERFGEEGVLRVVDATPDPERNVGGTGYAGDALVLDGVGNPGRLGRFVLVHVQVRPGDGPSLGIEPASEAARDGGPVAVLGDILLPRPDELHRRIRRLGDAHRLDHEIVYRTTPERAAEIGVVDGDGVRFEAGRFRCGGAGAEGVLGAGPDLADSVVQPGGAVQRLHGGVGEIRHPVVGCDRPAGGAQGRLDIAAIDIRFATALGLGGGQGVVELGEDSGLIDGFSPAGAPLDLDRRQGAVGMPVAVGDHGHGIAKIHNLLDAGKTQRRRIVDGGDTAAENRTRPHGGDLEPGQLDIDAERRRAVHLGGDVEPRFGCAD